MSDQPVLPYPDAVTGVSSGWSGSETSADRAHKEDATGVTTKRQGEVLGALAWREKYGATWVELGNNLGLHHGQISGPLSVLHKAGKIARLTEKRDRCAVYVLPTFVGERETAKQGRKRPSPNLDVLDEVRALHRPSANKDPEYCVYCSDSMGEDTALWPCETVVIIERGRSKS